MREYWWGRRANEYAGIAGTTDVSVSTLQGDNYFIFSAPEYYNPNYNPLKGYGYEVNVPGTVLDFFHFIA